MANYNKILELGPNPTKAEIKQAYRRLAHKYHPDKAGGDGKKFIEVKEAYEFLMNQPDLPYIRSEPKSPNNPYQNVRSDYFDDLLRRQQTAQDIFAQRIRQQQQNMEEMKLNLILTQIQSLSKQEREKLINKILYGNY